MGFRSWMWLSAPTRTCDERTACGMQQQIFPSNTKFEEDAIGWKKKERRREYLTYMIRRFSIAISAARQRCFVLQAQRCGGSRLMCYRLLCPSHGITRHDCLPTTNQRAHYAAGSSSSATSSSSCPAAETLDVLDIEVLPGPDNNATDCNINSSGSGSSGTFTSVENTVAFKDVVTLDNFARAKVLNFIKRTAKEHESKQRQQRGGGAAGGRGAFSSLFTSPTSSGGNAAKVGAESSLTPASSVDGQESGLSFFDTREIRVNEATHYHARLPLPLPQEYGSRCGEGIGSTVKDAETLAAMHAESIIDALGFQIYNLASMQKKHAETARGNGRWAPMPNADKPPLHAVTERMHKHSEDVSKVVEKAHEKFAEKHEVFVKKNDILSQPPPPVHQRRQLVDEAKARSILDSRYRRTLDIAPELNLDRCQHEEGVQPQDPQRVSLVTKEEMEKIEMSQELARYQRPLQYQTLNMDERLGMLNKSENKVDSAREKRERLITRRQTDASTQNFRALQAAEDSRQRKDEEKLTKGFEAKHQTLAKTEEASHRREQYFGQTQAKASEQSQKWNEHRMSVVASNSEVNAKEMDVIERTERHALRFVPVPPSSSAHGTGKTSMNSGFYVTS